MEVGKKKKRKGKFPPPSVKARQTPRPKNQGERERGRKEEEGGKALKAGAEGEEGERESVCAAFLRQKTFSRGSEDGGSTKRTFSFWREMADWDSGLRWW